MSKEASNHGEEDENEENKDEKGGNGDKLSKKYKNGKTSTMFGIDHCDKISLC